MKGCDNMSSTNTNTEMRDSVIKVINESEDLVSALEAVGAMYGIPSTNILADDSLKSIKVVNDSIIAPSNVTNTQSNTKAIVCSIGAVLDYISQRIDDKLNNFQTDAIETSKNSSIRRESNPSKGNVVGRYIDDNGDEIIVYDTGSIDIPDTDEARRKVDELRQTLKIPMYAPDAMRNRSSYFSDEDDITAGIDISTDNTVSSADNIETVDVADSIQESALHLDLISQFNNTRHLGYDLLHSQGFDYIKPVGIIQEGASKKNDNISIAVNDIKHMKFDNTNILKAIKYFNEARAEQPDAKKGEFDIHKFINSEKYQKGLDALCKQFDARITVRFIDVDYHGNDLYTEIYKDIKNNLTISKSKGFQLNGLPISIYVINKALDEDAPDDIELFGQSVVSCLLHEIFHNICGVWRYSACEFNASLHATLAIAGGIRKAKNRRVFLTNFVNTLDEFYGVKMNRITRRILVKQLSILVSVQYDDKAVNAYKKKLTECDMNDMSDEEIDKLIKEYEKIVRRTNRNRSAKKLIPTAIITAVSIIFHFVLPKSLNIFGCGIHQLCAYFGSLAATKLIIDGCMISAINAIKREYESSKEYEEFYCDMFAAMYNLPVTFFIGQFSDRKYTANEIDTERLNKLAKLEKDIYELSFSSYPTMMERNHAATKIAKNLLDSGEEIDPSIKKYLQWIVDNYSTTLDTEIEEIYNQTTFDPKTADDLDAHLQKLITQNEVVLTESDLSWIFDVNDVICESVQRMNDTGDSVPETCPACGSKIGLYLEGEPVWLCSNKKCKKCFGTLPFFK